MTRAPQYGQTTFPSASTSSRLFNSKGVGMPLLRMRDVLSDRTEAHYDGPYNEHEIVEPGDLIIGMDGEFNCARWVGPRALLNQRVCRVNFMTHAVNRDFVFFALPGYLRAINAATPSVTVKHLSSKSVADIPLPLPPRLLLLSRRRDRPGRPRRTRGSH
jgi:type I restriction enzyme S subunit